MSFETCTVTLLDEYSGNTMTLGGRPIDKYRIIAIDGLTALPFGFSTSRNADMQTTYIDNKLAQPRLITIQFEVDNILAEREFLTSFFNPFTKGQKRFDINWNRNQKYIFYEPYPITISQPSTYSRMTCTVDLFCADPFFRGEDIVQAGPYEVRELEVPGIDPRAVTAWWDFDISNDGDVSVPFSVLFENSWFDTNTNPTIEMEIDGVMKRMEAEVDLAPYDKIQFSTDPLNLHVIQHVYDGVGGYTMLDVENKTTIDHEYFMIPTGVNRLSCGLTGGEPGMAGVTVTGVQQHLGV